MKFSIGPAVAGSPQPPETLARLRTLSHLLMLRAASACAHCPTASCFSRTAGRAVPRSFHLCTLSHSFLLLSHSWPRCPAQLPPGFPRARRAAPSRLPHSYKPPPAQKKRLSFANRLSRALSCSAIRGGAGKVLGGGARKRRGGDLRKTAGKMGVTDRKGKLNKSNTNSLNSYI